MEYAVILYFDSKTETIFNELIRLVVDDNISSYMCDNQVKPHITIADFKTENIEAVIQDFDENIVNFSSGEVIWASIGAFVPRVIFAAPMMNEYLLTICQESNNIISKNATPCEPRYYLPFQWVPHTTLASNLDIEKLNQAFKIITRHFNPTKGHCMRLSIIQCDQVKEIKTWKL